MTSMGSKLDIQTEKLASAAGKAAQTLAASAVPAIPPPPPTATSQLDGALVGLATASEAMRVKVDAEDSVWATKQQAALTESPPVLSQQDQQGAQDYTRAATQFPTPAMIPGGVAGKVYNT